MNTQKTSYAGRGRRNFGPLLLGIFILAIVAVLVISFSIGRMMMDGSPPQTAQQFAFASPGTDVNIVLQVTTLTTSTLLEGAILQKNGDGSYSRTVQRVNVRWNPSQAMTMGSSSDVKVGAILQVRGTLDAQNILASSQMVVLTGYVQVK